MESFSLLQIAKNCSACVRASLWISEFACLFNVPLWLPTAFFQSLKGVEISSMFRIVDSGANTKQQVQKQPSTERSQLNFSSHCELKRRPLVFGYWKLAETYLCFSNCKTAHFSSFVSFSRSLTYLATSTDNDSEKWNEMIRDSLIYNFYSV